MPKGPERNEPELTAGPDQDPPEMGLDPTLPVNPARGTPGHQVKESPSEDEDDNGRSMGEQLFAKGARAAERDKMGQAAGATHRSDRREP